MDSPETAKTTTTTSSSSDSAAVQDSPIFSYISNLSPIQPVKAAHVAQDFPGLNSPPLVFTSPHINPHREASFLKRPQCPQSSSAEVSQNDDGGKKITSDPDVPGKSTQLSSGLISCAEKECDTEASMQAQHCSSLGCIDEYLADSVEVDCANSEHSANLSLKQAYDEHQSSLGGLTDLKKSIAKLDNKKDIREDVEMKADTSPAMVEKSEKDLQGKSTSHVKLVETEEKQRSGDRLSSECPNIESNMSVDHASKEQQCEHTVAQNTGGHHQDKHDCVPQLLLGSLQIIQAYEDCGEDAGAISNGPIEKMVLRDPEASQHKCGMRRCCLQFEETHLNTIANSPSSSNPTNSVTKSRSPASHADSESEILESSCVDLTATSSNRQLVNLPQPINTMFSPRSSRNSPLTVSKPSGIGLHLNRIVSAVPISCVATTRFNLGEKEYLSVQGLKSESVMNCHLLENRKSSSNAVEKVLASSEVGMHETKASIAASSATCQSPQGMKPLNNPVLLKPTERCATPHEKGKSNLEHADCFEEFNQPSPKKKRKKALSTIDGEGCKRCNCKRTKCLKLYCNCFAAGIYCAEPCACQGCFNRPEYEDTVLETRQQIESRNPLAFAPKIVQRVTESPANSVEDGNQLAPSSTRHKRGCNCKKSMCLKKYCECYQANVGCSDGCRCEGCKNAYGRKEDYGVTKEMASQRANDGSLEGTADEKVEMVATRKGLSHAHLCNLHNLTPLTPLFQYSDHGKDAPKSRLLSRRYLPSPESDLTALSSYGKSPISPRSSDSHDMPLNTHKEILDKVSYDLELDHRSSERVNQLSPSDDGLAFVCNHTPLSDSLSTATASSSSSKTRDLTSSSGVQLCPGSGRPSSGSSLRWRSSPITPMTRLGGTKLLQGLNSDNGIYDILEDDTPEILKNTSTPIKAMKVTSPNQKRVSPPHNRLQEVGSSSSVSLRSGRKFILQAVPSFPPLTPCIDAKGSINQNKSDFQDSSSNK